MKTYVYYYSPRHIVPLIKSMEMERQDVRTYNDIQAFIKEHTCIDDFSIVFFDDSMLKGILTFIDQNKNTYNFIMIVEDAGQYNKGNYMDDLEKICNDKAVEFIPMLKVRMCLLNNKQYTFTTMKTKDETKDKDILKRLFICTRLDGRSISEIRERLQYINNLLDADIHSNFYEVINVIPQEYLVDTIANGDVDEFPTICKLGFQERFYALAKEYYPNILVLLDDSLEYDMYCNMIHAHCAELGIPIIYTSDIKASKPIKVFISQPMSGLMDEEIRRTRQQCTEDAIDILKKRFGDDVKVDIIETYFPDEEEKHPLKYLGRDLDLLADADYIYFADSWQSSKGCKVEYIAATTYGIEIIRNPYGELITCIMSNNNKPNANNRIYQDDVIRKSLQQFEASSDHPVSCEIRYGDDDEM